MPDVAAARPEDLGFDARRLQRAYDLLQRRVNADELPAAALCVGRNGRMVAPRFFGRQRPEQGAPPLQQNALFLIASITKPITATAIMMLMERGELTLQDRVADFVPRFAQHGKQDIRILHLMTHTSGLPDMLPNNEQLRRRHRPLSAFIDEVCGLRPAFAPGTRMSYQSMGIAMLAEVVHQISGRQLSEFLRQEIFTPLGMTDTFLGCDAAHRQRVAQIRLPAAQARQDWNWNSAYWLGFGAPWGGLLTTPADLARFCQMMLNGGSLGNVRILSPAAVRAMTSNHLETMSDIPEADRRCRPWGLGWRLNWPADPGSFGDLLSPRAYGHWGATGTLCWLDPDARAFFILFTTRPLGEHKAELARLSNIVMSAIVRNPR